MKRILLVAVLFAAVSGVKAQDAPNQNAIKLNPLSLVFATGNVSYERAVGENQSVQLGVFYSGVSLSGIKYAGLGITPEYRFYFGGKRQALNGVYAAPFLRYQNFSLKEKESGDKATYSSFGGGAIIGWQKMWDSGFVLDLFAGPAYNSGKFKNDSEGDEFDISGGIDGFGLRTGITLGFGF
jgi:hypothetical protein